MNQSLGVLGVVILEDVLVLQDVIDQSDLMGCEEDTILAVASVFEDRSGLEVGPIHVDENLEWLLGVLFAQLGHLVVDRPHLTKTIVQILKWHQVGVFGWEVAIKLNSTSVLRICILNSGVVSLSSLRDLILLIGGDCNVSNLIFFLIVVTWIVVGVLINHLEYAKVCLSL